MVGSVNRLSVKESKASSSICNQQCLVKTSNYSHIFLLINDLTQCGLQIPYGVRFIIIDSGTRLSPVWQQAITRTTDWWLTAEL